MISHCAGPVANADVVTCRSSRCTLIPSRQFHLITSSKSWAFAQHRFLFRKVRQIPGEGENLASNSQLCTANGHASNFQLCTANGYGTPQTCNANGQGTPQVPLSHKRTAHRPDRSQSPTLSPFPLIPIWMGSLPRNFHFGHSAVSSDCQVLARCSGRNLSPRKY